MLKITATIYQFAAMAVHNKTLGQWKNIHKTVVINTSAHLKKQAKNGHFH